MIIEVNPELTKLIEKIESDYTKDDERVTFTWLYNPNGNGAIGYAGAYRIFKEFDLTVNPNGYISAQSRDVSKYEFDNFDQMEYDSEYEVV